MLPSVEFTDLDLAYLLTDLRSPPGLPTPGRRRGTGTDRTLRGWRLGSPCQPRMDQRREQAAVSIFVVAIIAEQPARARTTQDLVAGRGSSTGPWRLLQRIRDGFNGCSKSGNANRTTGLVPEILQCIHVFDGFELPRESCRADCPGQINGRSRRPARRRRQTQRRGPYEGTACCDRAKALTPAVGGQACALATSLGHLAQPPMDGLQGRRVARPPHRGRAPAIARAGPRSASVSPIG